MGEAPNRSTKSGNEGDERQTATPHHTLPPAVVREASVRETVRPYLQAWPATTCLAPGHSLSQPSGGRYCGREGLHLAVAGEPQEGG